MVHGQSMAMDESNVKDTPPDGDGQFMRGISRFLPNHWKNTGNPSLMGVLKSAPIREKKQCLIHSNVKPVP
jgi:hypothetical protein